MAKVEPETVYDKTAIVDPIKLIREVKKYEVLYNKELYGYSDLTKKEIIWEKIHQVLFPNYLNLSVRIRKKIRKTVRKRWKSLRDCIVKEMKARAERPNYVRKKQSPIIEEMMFITPFIKQHTPSTKLDIDYDSTNCSNSVDVDITNDDIDDDDSVDIIDYYSSKYLQDSGPDVEEVPRKLSVPGTIRVISEPLLKYNAEERDMSENSAGASFAAQFLKEHCSASTAKKRKRMSTQEFQTKVFELLAECREKEEEDNDEDRMFLLSLLSDFRQVLPHKKLKVKSQILALIGNGCQY